MILQINNITKIANNTYSIEFSSDFTLNDLFYEVSADGNSWSSPIAIDSSSPQNITVENMINFKLRLSSNYTPTPPPYTRIHTNVFTEVFN